MCSKPKGFRRFQWCWATLGFLLVGNALAAGPTDIQPVAAKLYDGAQTSLILDLEDTGERLVAVGERGHILLSADGDAWEQVIVPVDSLLTAVHFTSANEGWAVGHDAVILHTRDGGKSWDLQQFEPTGAGPLLDVFFDSPEHGFAVGAFGSFYETHDGGVKWLAVEVPVVVDAGAHLYFVSQFSTGRWLIVGEMGFVATSLDGVQWQAVESPYYGSFYAAASYAKNGAILVGMRGNAYSIEDFNASAWTRHDTGTVLSLTSISRTEEQEFLITTLNRQLLKFDGSGSVSPLSLPEQEGQATNSGSFNDVLVRGRNMLIASDHGVLKLPSPAERQASASGP